MTYERWQEIFGRIKDNFSIEDQGREHLDDEGGVDVDYVVFKSSLGRIKLELISKPVIVDKKINYSKRIGSHSQVDYVYSETEKTYKMNAYKWDDEMEDWIEIAAKNFE